MMNQIKLFFEQHLAISAAENTLEDKLKLATVVLFIEMMMMDDKAEPKEQDLILSLIEQNFSLMPEQSAALMVLADSQRKQATDYFQFTSLINQHYNLEQKVKLIESLWRIAFVDGILDANEEYLVRKIADLLYVPHTAFILTKNRVESEMKKYS